MQNTAMGNTAGESRPPYLIESVDLAAQVLLLIREQRRVRVTDVAERLGVAKSTAHRLLMSLAWRGFVAQERTGKAYRAGPALYDIGLGVSAGVDVARSARRHIEALAATTRETVNLIVLEGTRCRFVDGVEGAHQLRVGLRTGNSLPAYAASGGKVLLAELDTADLRGLLSVPLTPLTDRTVRDVDELIRELARVRSVGYALNVQESEEGVGAVAVRVLGPHGGVMAALAVAIPALRMTRDRIPQLVEQLQATSSDITEDLYQ